MRNCIGIFGGTFDPIHIGHLRMALELKQQLQLDEMRLLPCYLPPHRPTPGATANERVAMLKLALQDCAELVIDERELQRDKPSYTYDTLRELRAEVGAEVSLCLCMGMDSFATLDTWHNWGQLLQLAHIVVVARPGWFLPESGAVAELLNVHRRPIDAIAQQAAGAIVLLEQRLLPISATDIRAQIHAGSSPQFLLPDGVWNYISAHKLYQ
ncbi:nicotinate-nucleotide adenylyltransferase [Cellvibrio sp. OA-2007]|uniref:nicotinate-nucleotide adenylyltransferase n=1 Tax=Cellvibrio sp. OA-2007 TaxID=529823 RepID=UPI000784FEA6|nr:nicotinate-nucleotide adenylyltransferase [Cellvibrio sp. OA-2007]